MNGFITHRGLFCNSHQFASDRNRWELYEPIEELPEWMSAIRGEVQFRRYLDEEDLFVVEIEEPQFKRIR